MCVDLHKVAVTNDSGVARILAPRSLRRMRLQNSISNPQFQTICESGTFRSREVEPEIHLVCIHRGVSFCFLSSATDVAIRHPLVQARILPFDGFFFFRVRSLLI